MSALYDFAAAEVDAFVEEHRMTYEWGFCENRSEMIESWSRRLAATGGIPDEVLEAMPEISRDNEPQISPQEYDCGCVATTRITDRDYRRHERPFEMRLALPCDGSSCELAHLRGGKHE